MNSKDGYLSLVDAHEIGQEIVRRHERAVYCAVVDALVDKDRKKMRFLDDAEVERRTTLSHKLRLALEAKGLFPSRIPLSDRSTAYLEEEIERWMEEKISGRDEALGKRRSPNPLAKANRQAKAKASRRTKTTKKRGKK